MNRTDSFDWCKLDTKQGTSEGQVRYRSIRLRISTKLANWLTETRCAPTTPRASATVAGLVEA
jgi:hypothetical protein